MKNFFVTVEETNIVVYTVLASSKEEAEDIIRAGNLESCASELIDSNLENIINVE